MQALRPSLPNSVAHVAYPVQWFPPPDPQQYPVPPKNGPVCKSRATNAHTYCLRVKPSVKHVNCYRIAHYDFQNYQSSVKTCHFSLSSDEMKKSEPWNLRKSEGHVITESRDETAPCLPFPQCNTNSYHGYHFTHIASKLVVPISTRKITKRWIRSLSLIKTRIERIKRQPRTLQDSLGDAGNARTGTMVPQGKQWQSSLRNSICRRNTIKLCFVALHRQN